MHTSEPDLFKSLNTAILDQLPVSIALFNKDMMCLACSRVWRETFEIADPTMIGKSFYELFPDTTRSWKSTHQRCLNGEAVHIDTERHESSDGTVHYLDWDINPWRDDAGAVMGVCIMTRNVTDRVEKQHRLRNDELRWKYALEGSGDGLWDWNMTTDEVYFSTQWKAMLGFSDDEISGSLHEWERRVHPQQLERVHAEIQAYLQGDTEIYRSEHQVLCNDGSYKWILDRGVIAERDAHGNPIRMIGTHTDIDSGKKSIEQASLLSNRYTSMFRDHDAIMFMFDAQSGRIIDANTSAERFYGYSHDEFLNLSIDRINTLPSTEIRKRMKAAATNRTNAFVFQHRLKNGSLRNVEVHSSPITTENGVVLYSIIKDITQEHENEQRLHKTLEQLNQAKKIAHLGVWEHDLISNRLTWSDEIFEIFELDKKGFNPSYETFVEVIHPDDRQRVHNAYQHSLETRKEYRITHRLLMPDGRIKHVQEQCATDFDNNGKPLRSIGTVYDITQIQALSDTMRRDKERYENLMKYSSDGIIIMDSSGKVQEVNLTQARMLGYTPDEFLSLSILDWDAKFDPASLDELLTNISHKAISFETIHRRKDGTTYDAAVTAVRIRIDDKEYLYAATRDITEQKRAEDKFRKLLEFASDGIHILDESGNLVYYSRSFAEMLGYAYEDLASLNVSDWDASISESELLKTVKTLIHEPSILETRHRRRDGSCYDAQINAKGIELDGNRYLYASARDISVEKQLEQEIIAERNFVSTIVDTANAVIAVIRMDGVMSRVNRYAEQFTGYTKEEIASEPYFWSRFLNPLMRDKVTDIIAKARKGEIVSSFQNSWLSKTGMERMFEWSNTLVCQADGSIDYLVTIGIDITDKVEAQLKLLNQKEEFETIFEYSKDGLAILDQESRFLKFNDAFLHMTGYDRQTLRSLSLIELSTPDDMQRTREAFREVRKHGFITHFEVSGQRKDGIPITINMSVVLMPDRVRLLVSAKDMTQDKALREELIAAKQKGDSLLHEQDSLLSLFDKGDSVLFKWKNDAEWHVEYVSDNVQRLLGYYKESFQRGDISYAECIHPHDMTHVYDEVQNAKQNNLDFFNHEAYRIITSEGKVKWILDHTVTQKNSAGEITHFIGYITDISSQKAAETDLIRARDEAQRLFNYTPIPLVYVANNGRVININQKFTEELGYVIEDIPDTQVWFTLAYPDMKYRQRVMETWTQEVIKANEEHRAIPPQEYRVRCKNGDYRTLLISGIFVGQDMIVSFFDMTEVKRSRKALEQAKIAAEKANHAKSAFLANMSHEMRTPLNGIIGLTDIVLNSDLQPVQRGYLEKAQQASHALLTIINDILDYSKIEAGKMDIVPTRFELHSVTKNISSLFGYRIHAKNLSFRVDIDASIPPVLIGDALRLTQILNNLVGNSVKFTESGHIHIDITTLEKTAGAIILGFSIEDTGIGISSEHINKLFQAFEQGDQSTTRRFGGSGLGLMITKQLLNLMGGEITVASEVGSGTVFSFTLPLHYEETSNPDFQQSQEPRQVHRKRLTEVKAALLIEDNETNQLVASLLLEEMGFQVTIARDGKQGIELCRQNPYDIIFMDIQMPVMDGYEASRRIREFNTRIPIIALSAAAMQSDRILSESAGMNQHIAKPIDLRELTRVICEYFELLDVTHELMAFPQQSVHLDCADLEGVMSMINKGVYTVYDMYDNFKNNYRDTLDTLDLPRESKAFGNYIHRLKGVSGNLRIHKIHNLTRSIESGVTVEADIAALKTEMRRVLDEIEEKLSPELQTIVDTANDAPPEILLAQILADVRQTSYIPSEKITSLVHSLETVIDQETREKLLKFYDSFDYAGMETTLNAIDRAMHGE